MKHYKYTETNYSRFQILPCTVLKTLLEFASKKSHFIFDGKYYEQTDGVAMGSLVGPLLANTFMYDFEDKSVMTGNPRPSIWFRNVDDTFTMFVGKHTALTFL